MTLTTQGKLTDWIRISIIVLVMLFGCLAGYTNLRGDVKRSQKDITANSVSIKEGVNARQSLSEAVVELKVEIKNVNKNLAKIEKKL